MSEHERREAAGKLSSDHHTLTKTKTKTLAKTKDVDKDKDKGRNAEDSSAVIHSTTKYAF